MRFGPVETAEALGAILAHSHPLADGRLRKGHRLTEGDLEALTRNGVDRVTVARLGPDDLDEDAAAEALARALVPDAQGAHLRLGRAATGRVNIHATGPGILRVRADPIVALNALDPNITLATLPPLARVATGQMVATVKIISYGVARATVSQGAALLPDALCVSPVVLRDADLIITDMGAGPGKGEAALAMRLERLGMSLRATRTVPHEEAAIAGALRESAADLVLLLTASATSDIHDVGPEGLRRAGGTVTRFGMPVDPGNLLFLGQLGGRPVIGLPGCARSPALNGADWVLERIVCGHVPDAAEFAAMGIGGLLKEPPSRPHPRRG